VVGGLFSNKIDARFFSGCGSSGFGFCCFSSAVLFTLVVVSFSGMDGRLDFFVDGLEIFLAFFLCHECLSFFFDFFKFLSHLFALLILLPQLILKLLFFPFPFKSLFFLFFFNAILFG
jgi:hypothetical protein